jgi:cyclic-di-GMP-binding biofilm dispersal mediator protein
MEREIAGSSILIAGATGVLGHEIARLLAEAGAALTLFGRSADRLAGIDLAGPRVVGDLADAEACEQAVKAAVAAHGKLDGVVNAAGVVAFGKLESLSDATLDELVTTNLIGPLRLMRAALPAIERGGFLANLSAIVAERPMAGMAAYSAVKAALTALDQALVRELRAQRVDVIDLRPPHTETGLAARAIAGEAPKLPTGLAPEQVAARIVQAIRSGEREVAASDFSAPTGTH